MELLQNFEIVELLHSNRTSEIFHALNRDNGSSVILKCLKERYPDAINIARYKSEFDILHTIRAPGVIKVLEFIESPDATCLVLEDFGGKSLHQLKDRFILKETSKLERLLNIFLKLTQALEAIHTARVIHKDINPSNIVMNETTDEIKFIDFGSASKLKHETPQLSHPGQIEGNLAYISPEQTGRMNRTLDHRSDIYSLGIVFYELLSGYCPFTSDDPLTLIHSHIAVPPKPLHAMNQFVPRRLSDIVMKMIALSVEDRYQSAFGVKSDLEGCLSSLTHKSGAEVYELGRDDFLGSFQIPQKLYGRQSNINDLMTAFNEASTGQRRLMLVSGSSGVGKTALVHEVHKPMTQKNGLFISGKFDQFNRNIPYSAFTAAFNEFCLYILSEPPERLVKWKEIILSSIGNNGRLLLDLIPNLMPIIGDQPPVVDLPPLEAQNRLNSVFQQFIGGIGRSENPITLFIDDWQWADQASLSLFKNVLGDESIQYLFLIAAYRDNEVSSSHPFMVALSDLETLNVPTDKIHLSNLKKKEVGELIQDTLRVNLEECAQLSSYVFEKTAGNAFFVHQFMIGLAELDLLSFDYNQQRWIWDIDQIANLPITDNVVDLLTAKITKLPDQEQSLITLAATIGSSFNLNTLAIAAETPLLEIYNMVTRAFNEGFVTPLDDNYKYAEQAIANASSTNFRFLHDRVHQAAYSLIPEEDLASVHLKIGRLMVEEAVSKIKLEDYPATELFRITRHFNRGKKLINSHEERSLLIELNETCAHKAAETAAFDSADDHYQIILSILPQDMWKTHYHATFNAKLGLAQCAYIVADFERSRKLFDEIFANVQGLAERAEAASSLIAKHIIEGQNYERAIEIGTQTLNHFGVSFPFGDTALAEAIPIKRAEVDAEIERLSIKELRSLKPLEDASKEIVYRLFVDLYTLSFVIGKFELLTYSSLNLIDYTLKNGVSRYSAYGFATLSLTANVEGRSDDGLALGKLALDLNEAYPDNPTLGKLLNIFSIGVQPYKRPYRDSFELLRRSIVVNSECGENAYCAWAIFFNTYIRFVSGQPLSAVREELSRFMALLKRFNDPNMIRVYVALEETIKRLSGEEPDPATLTSAEFDENEAVKFWMGNQYLGAYNWYTNMKMLLAIIFGDYQKAVEFADASAPFEWAHFGFFPMTTLRIHQTLAMYCAYDDVPSDEQARFDTQIETNMERIDAWSNNCPENFRHWLLALKAEKARKDKKFWDAAVLFDQANALAQENRLLGDQALINERAGLNFLEGSIEGAGAHYLSLATSLYGKWGANAKVKQMEATYGQLSLTSPQLTDKHPSGNLSTNDLSTWSSSQTNSDINTLLDMTAVVKATQAISGEIQLERLVAQLLKIVMEVAGAENAALVLPDKDSWILEARTSVGEETVTPRVRLNYDEKNNSDKPQLPLMLLQYVRMTSKELVLDDASTEERFDQDNYIKNQKPRSILCLPILRNNNLSGLLYMENNRSSGVFSLDRVEIVRILAAQSAISLENAGFYRSLADSEKRYRSLYENAVEGIFRAAPSGEIINVNPAFSKILGYANPKDFIKAFSKAPQSLYVDPKDQSRWMDMLEEGQAVLDFETQLLNRNREVVWVSLSGRAERDSNAQVICYEGSILDISGRKAKEIAERKSNEAMAANKAKGEFLARMSHEIRTPMNAVIGLARLLSKTPVNELQRDYIDKICHSSEILLEIINDILDLSKIEAQKLELEEIDFDLEALISKVVNICSHKAYEKELELVADIDPNVPFALKGDPLRLQQVLVNLTNNAVKFTNEGSVSIKIECLDKSNSIAELKFSVIDTGIGMPKEQLKGLFKSFTQADETITRKYGGTGLGLAISKQLTEMMNGSIDVKSQEGIGSRFSIVLPLAYSEQIIQMENKVPSLKKLSDLKTLIVDDSDIARDVLADILKTMNIKTVKQAENGKQALDLVIKANEEGAPFNLILMDWKMPVMDGVKAAIEIRKLMGNEAPQILMVSAYDRDKIRNIAGAAGIQYFVEKPIIQSSLLNAINAMIEKSFELTQSNVEKDHVTVPDLRDKRILLVEDNDINEVVARGILADTHVKISSAQNGLIALDKIKKNSYDLVLMDIQMPEMDGLTAAHLIRTELKLDIPIIAMTAHAMSDDIEKSLKAGMNDHITKPIEPDVLYEVLDKFLHPSAILVVDQNEEKETPIENIELLNPLSELQDTYGLNITEALLLVQGDEKLYLTLAESYRNKRKDSKDQLLGYYNEGQTDKLANELHTMKTNLAYLGDGTLSAKANELENQLRAGKDISKNTLEGFLKRNDEIIDILNKVLPEYEASPPQKLNILSLRTAIQDLKPLLIQSDGAAEDNMSHILEITKGTTFEKDVKELYHLISDFEFDEAIQKLASIEASLDM